MAADYSLDNKELTYVQDRDFLLTKHQIGRKVNQLLIETEGRLKTFIKNSELEFPQEVKFRAGKIAKGENYRLLPYYILDFPRQFDQQSIFALRTMFWWGHPFSVTLHLSGLARAYYLPSLMQNKQLLDGREVYLYQRADDPWQHHYSEENFLLVGELSGQAWRAKLEELPHIKLATFLAVEQWNHLPDFTIDFFRQLVKALSLQA